MNILLWITVAFAQLQVPCLEQNAKKEWVMVEGSECSQYNKAQQLELTERLLRLEHYMKTLEPSWQLMEKNYKRMDELWKQSEQNWQKQREQYQGITEIQQKEATTWRTAFYELEKRKNPQQHWYQHPALWFTVGAVVTVGVIIGAAYLVGEVRKQVNP